MRTLEEIKGRCTIELGDREGEEHWIWQGCLNKGVPWVRYHRPDGTSETCSTIRAAWLMTHKRPPGPRHRVVKVCDRVGCVNPACAKRMTHAQWGDSRAGKDVGNPRYRIAGLKSAAQWRVLTKDQAGEILASNESNAALARRLGFKSTSPITRVRNGTHSLARSPFAGLLA